MAMAVSLIIIMIVVLISFVLLYALFYNRIINQKIKNQESIAHISLVPIDTVGKVIFAIGVVVILFMILSELRELDTLITLNRNQLFGLEAQISDLRMEQVEDSFLNEVSLEYGKIDAKNHTVEVNFYCTTKLCSEDAVLNFDFNGEKVELTCNEDGEFIGTKAMPLFHVLGEEVTVMLKYQGIMQREKRDDLFPECFARECLVGELDSWSSGYSTEGNTLELEGDLSILAGEFTETKLVVLENGEVIKEQNFMNENGEAGGNYRVNVDLAKVENGKIQLAFRGKDHNGYIHEIGIVTVIMENGRILEVMDDSFNQFFGYYDEQGNELFHYEFE